MEKVSLAFSSFWWLLTILEWLPCVPTFRVQGHIVLSSSVSVSASLIRTFKN